MTFQGFLHHFVLAKLVTSSMKVNIHIRDETYTPVKVLKLHGHIFLQPLFSVMGRAS